MYLLAPSEADGTQAHSTPWNNFIPDRIMHILGGGRCLVFKAVVSGSVTQLLRCEAESKSGLLHATSFRNLPVSQGPLHHDALQLTGSHVALHTNIRTRFFLHSEERALSFPHKAAVWMRCVNRSTGLPLAQFWCWTVASVASALWAPSGTQPAWFGKATFLQAAPTWALLAQIDHLFFLNISILIWGHQ